MFSSNKDIFRKVTLERLSSPDELDRLMQITQPRAWLLLAAVALLLGAALLWAIFGTITLDVPVTGTLVTIDAPAPADGAGAAPPLGALVYVREADAARVQTGQEARLLVAGLSAEQTGFLLGTVSAVGGAAADPSAAAPGAAAEPLVEVQIALIPDAGTASGFRWTAMNGPGTPLRAGTSVTGTIVLQQLQPIQFVLGGR